MFCPYCYREIPDGSIFCPECGERLPQSGRRRGLDRDSRIRRLIVAGVAVVAAVAVAMPTLIRPMLTQTVEPVPTAQPSITTTAAPAIQSTAAPAAQPTAMTTAVPAIQSTAVPTVQPMVTQSIDPSTPSRAIRTMDDACALMGWMIETNTLEVQLERMDLSRDQIKTAAQRFPQVRQYSWSSTTLKLSLATGAQILAALQNGDEAVLSDENTSIARQARQVISQLITPGMSDLEKEIAIHNYIIHHCDYEINDGLNTSDARGFFDHGRAQCSGYSDTFRLLGGLCGLEIASLSGEIVGEDGGHEWNLIRLDGLWYAVDVTWDDPKGGGAENGMYLNVPLRALDSDHVYDRAALPEGTFAQSFDQNYYYAHRKIMVATLSEAEQLLRSQFGSGSTAEVCSVGGEMDVSGLVKKIMNERSGSWSWNTAWIEGPDGVVLYTITLK